MEDVKFVLKCIAITAVLVLLMQIRVGQHTIEGHTMAWIHHSPISHVLQDVAEGAVKVSKQGSDAVSGFVKSQRSPESEENAPAPTEASTGGWFKIKRSAAYRRQKEREKHAHQQSMQNEDESAVPNADETERD